MRDAYRLIEFREREGITQSELGKRLGVGQTLISMYESGRRTPSYQMLCQIADMIGVDVDTLISDKTTRVLNKRVGREQNPDGVPKTRPRKAALDERGDLKIPVRIVLGSMFQARFVDGCVTEQVETPPCLRGVENAYAGRVVNDDMSPRYSSGMLLYLNPQKPLTRDCGVVVVMQDGAALIAEFRTKTGSEIEVITHLSSGLTTKFDVSKILRIDAIAGSVEV